MSELQAALLAIGFGVIVAVYVWGGWQQRRYRRKFGATFKANHAADALYQQSSAPLISQIQHAALAGADEALGGETIANVEITYIPQLALSATSFPDDPCSLLNARSDFIIELHWIDREATV